MSRYTDCACSAAWGPPTWSPRLSTGRSIPMATATSRTTSSPSNGCSAISGVSGNIALIARGTCTFKTKVYNAQLAGAIGVVITNNVFGFPIPMGNDQTVPDPSIPAMMIMKSDGDNIRATIASPATVNVTLTATYRNQIHTIL